MEVSYSKAGCLFEGFDILPKVFFFVIQLAACNEYHAAS